MRYSATKAKIFFIIDGTCQPPTAAFSYLHDVWLHLDVEFNE
jgi:hypothetical protein